ncbi:MAG TPA: EamA family transporter [Acidimicrobiales bacterium]|nr:EamA family transporter [Acidimicrobiales bacterium]
MTRRGWLLFGALGVIWGLPYFMIKVAVRELHPAFLVFVRTGGGAAVLLPLAAARGELAPALRRWRPVLVFAAVEIGVPWFLLFSAETRVSSSLSALLIATVPLFAALVAWVTRSERLDARRLGGLAVGFGGVAVLVGFDVGRSDVLATVSLGAVGLGYALGPWVVARRLSDLPSLGVVALSLAACTAAYAAPAALEVPARTPSAPVLASVVGLTAACTVVAFVALFALVAEVGAMRATVITYVNPAVAVLVGVAALGEPFGLASGAGFALILAGCVLATRPAPGAPALVAPPVAEP